MRNKKKPSANIIGICHASETCWFDAKFVAIVSCKARSTTIQLICAWSFSSAPSTHAATRGGGCPELVARTGLHRVTESEMDDGRPSVDWLLPPIFNTPQKYPETWFGGGSTCIWDHFRECFSMRGMEFPLNHGRTQVDSLRWMADECWTFLRHSRLIVENDAANVVTWCNGRETLSHLPSGATWSPSSSKYGDAKRIKIAGIYGCSSQKIIKNWYHRCWTIAIL